MDLREKKEVTFCHLSVKVVLTASYVVLLQPVWTAVFLMYWYILCQWVFKVRTESCVEFDLKVESGILEEVCCYLDSIFRYNLTDFLFQFPLNCADRSTLLIYRTRALHKHWIFLKNRQLVELEKIFTHFNK